MTFWEPRQKVSVLSTSVSIAVLALTLMLPHVLGRMRRRWAYTLGIVLLMAASLALASHVLAGQAARHALLRNIGAAIMNISLSLYILDHIRRNDLARAEPLRLSLSTFSWMTGPALGVWLYVNFGPWGPQLVAIAAGCAAAGDLLVPAPVGQRATPCRRATSAALQRA